MGIHFAGFNKNINGIMTNNSISRETKLTTPSLCYRENGKTMYVPLVLPGEGNGAMTSSNNLYYYDPDNRYSVKVAVRYNGKTYYIPTTLKIITQYAIPEGSYSPSSFATLIGKYMTYGGYRELASQCTVTVNGQTLTLTPGTRIYYIVASSYFKSAVGVGFGVSSFYENNVSQMHGSSGFTNKKVYVVGNPGDLYYFNLYANYYITVGTGINFK